MMLLKCIGRPFRPMSTSALDYLTKISQDQLIWKANENDPTNHNESHLGLFYNFPHDPANISKIMGVSHLFTHDYNFFLKTIGMAPVMIRSPALIIMDKINQSLSQAEKQKILIYGDYGHGKTHTLAHLLHYLQKKQNHFTLYVKWIRRFTSSPTEHVPSTSRTGRIDTPLDAANFLQSIKTMNEQLFEKLGQSLVCSQDYQWSSREKTKAGEPLMNIINHGTNRVIHASDCLAVLCKELMLASDKGQIRLVTVIKQVDELFRYSLSSDFKHPDRKLILVDEVTVARAYKKLVKNDYGNGLVIATCDKQTFREQNQTPETVLTEEGLAYFSDASRIHVPKYNRKEFENCMNMYQDIGWLARPESRTQEVRDEIRFVSGLNPLEVFNLCRAI